jgi:hypothetical protein
MSEELSKQLAALCESLGVKADHLWGVLVKQAFLDGLGSLTTIFFCGLLAIIVLFFYFHQRQKRKAQPVTAGEFKPLFSLLSEPTGSMLVVLVLLVLSAVASNNLYWVITDFFNPEYYALQHLPFPK